MPHDEQEDQDDMPAEAAEIFTESAVLIKQGWLTKKGGKKGLLGMTSWKKRWFKMTSDSIAYCDKEENGTVKGGILLETVTACRPATDTECGVANGFIIDANNERTFVMHASNVDDRDSWITQITLTVEALKPPPKPKAFEAPPKFEDPIQVCYWSCRGRAAALRMMCFYAEYEHVEFPMFKIVPKSEDEGGGWDASEWFCEAAKFSLAKSNALINLPYIVNKKTNQVITQSNACAMYLARRLDLLGNEEETIANEQLLGELSDMGAKGGKMFYTTDASADYEKYYGGDVATGCNKIVAWLEQRGNKFLVGSVPMVADFKFFEYLDTHESISNQILGRGFLGAYPRLQLYHADIKVLPTLKGYFAGEYGNLPMMGPTAKVGNSVDPAASAPLYDMATADAAPSTSADE
eukprot:m.161175 g.161175  ORF g.161175 m.161175 type:complete len:408 (+) comp23828_c0_seq1:2597-3820(+)